MSSFHGNEDFDLAAGCVYGIRYWSYSADFNHRKLPLTGVRGYWSKGVNLATCEFTWLSAPCVSATSYCACGFYAFWHINQPPLFSTELVAGVIKGYGRTLIGDKGFRCQKAEIVALSAVANSISGRKLRKLSKLYGVPVYASIGKMLAEHPLTKDYVNANTPNHIGRIIFPQKYPPSDIWVPGFIFTLMLSVLLFGAEFTFTDVLSRMIITVLLVGFLALTVVGALKVKELLT